MAMRYCLDANVFIQAKNGPYGLDIVPSFWEFLDEQSAAGVICSSSLVYKELAKGNDELAQWVKHRKGSGMFIEPDKQVQDVFAEIAQYVTAKYARHYADDFLYGADPWVIAQAKAENATVVTHEKMVGSDSSKAKIPNICSHFKVSYVDTYQMLRTLQARF